MNNQHSNEENLMKQADELLKRQTDHLDMKTTMALKRARMKALDASPEPRIISMGETLALEHRGLKNGILTLLVLTLLIFTYFNTNMKPSSSEQTPLFADMELLSSNESLDFYNDLEFYQWLDSNES